MENLEEYHMRYPVDTSCALAPQTQMLDITWMRHCYTHSNQEIIGKIQSTDCIKFPSHPGIKKFDIYCCSPLKRTMTTCIWAMGLFSDNKHTPMIRTHDDERTYKKYLKESGNTSSMYQYIRDEKKLRDPPFLSKSKELHKLDKPPEPPASLSCILLTDKFYKIDNNKIQPIEQGGTTTTIYVLPNIAEYQNPGESMPFTKDVTQNKTTTEQYEIVKEELEAEFPVTFEEIGNMKELNKKRNTDEILRSEYIKFIKEDIPQLVENHKKTSKLNEGINTALIVGHGQYLRKHVHPGTRKLDTSVCNDLVEYYDKVGKSSQKAFMIARILWESCAGFNLAMGNMAAVKTQESLVGVPEVVMCMSSCVAGRIVQNHCTQAIQKGTEDVAVYSHYVLTNLLSDVKLIQTDIATHKEWPTKYHYRISLAEAMKVHIRNLIKLPTYSTDSGYKKMVDGMDKLVQLKSHEQKASELENMMTTVFNDSSPEHTFPPLDLRTLESDIQTKLDAIQVLEESDIRRCFVSLMEHYSVYNITQTMMDTMLYDKHATNTVEWKSDYQHISEAMKKTKTDDLSEGQQFLYDRIVKVSKAQDAMRTASRAGGKMSGAVFKTCSSMLGFLIGGALVYFAGPALMAMLGIGGILANMFKLVLWISSSALVNDDTLDLIKHTMYEFKNVGNVYRKVGSEVYLKVYLGYLAKSSQNIINIDQDNVGKNLLDYLYRHTLYECTRKGRNTFITYGGSDENYTFETVPYSVEGEPKKMHIGVTKTGEDGTLKYYILDELVDKLAKKVSDGPIKVSIDIVQQQNEAEQAWNNLSKDDKEGKLGKEIGKEIYEQKLHGLYSVIGPDDVMWYYGRVPQCSLLDNDKCYVKFRYKNIKPVMGGGPFLKYLTKKVKTAIKTAFDYNLNRVYEIRGRWGADANFRNAVEKVSQKERYTQQEVLAIINCPLSGSEKVTKQGRSLLRRLKNKYHRLRSERKDCIYVGKHTCSDKHGELVKDGEKGVCNFAEWGTATFPYRYGREGKELADLEVKILDKLSPKFGQINLRGPKSLSSEIDDEKESNPFIRGMLHGIMRDADQTWGTFYSKAIQSIDPDSLRRAFMGLRTTLKTLLEKSQRGAISLITITGTVTVGIARLIGKLLWKIVTTFNPTWSSTSKVVEEETAATMGGGGGNKLQFLQTVSKIAEWSGGLILNLVCTLILQVGDQLFAPLLNCLQYFVNLIIPDRIGRSPQANARRIISKLMCAEYLAPGSQDCLIQHIKNILHIEPKTVKNYQMDNKDLHKVLYEKLLKDMPCPLALGGKGVYIAAGAKPGKQFIQGPTAVLCLLNKILEDRIQLSLRNVEEHKKRQILEHIDREVNFSQSTGVSKATLRVRAYIMKEYSDTRQMISDKITPTCALFQKGGLPELMAHVRGSTDYTPYLLLKNVWDILKRQQEYTQIVNEGYNKHSHAILIKPVGENDDELVYELSYEEQVENGLKIRFQPAELAKLKFTNGKNMMRQILEEYQIDTVSTIQELIRSWAKRCVVLESLNAIPDGEAEYVMKNILGQLQERTKS